MKPITATVQSPVKAVVAVGVSAVLAASLALAAPATAQAKAVKKPAKVKKPTVSKVKATSFKVSWKKAKRAKGYQVKVVKGSKTVKTITVKKKYCYATGLKAKTTYKVKVRAYNQSGKKKKYGKWSAVRKVTTSKSSSSSGSSSGSNSSSSTATTHTHNWSTDSCVGGSTRLYYCLQCGKFFEDKTDLESHASETGHFQQTWEGYIYEDGVKTARSSSAQGDYAYSYTTLKNTKLLSAFDHCSCGSTKTHAHSWKRVSEKLGKKEEMTLRFVCECGWVTDWNRPETRDELATAMYKHWKDSGFSSSHDTNSNDYGYGYANPSVAYDVCEGCGLVQPVI